MLSAAASRREGVAECPRRVKYPLRRVANGRRDAYSEGRGAAASDLLLSLVLAPTALLCGQPALMGLLGLRRRAYGPDTTRSVTR